MIQFEKNTINVLSQMLAVRTLLFLLLNVAILSTRIVNFDVNKLTKLNREDPMREKCAREWCKLFRRHKRRRSTQVERTLKEEVHIWRKHKRSITRRRNTRRRTTQGGTQGRIALEEQHE